MKKIILVISLMISLVLSSAEKTDFIREALAKNDGFASEGKELLVELELCRKIYLKLQIRKSLLQQLEIGKIRSLRF